MRPQRGFSYVIVMFLVAMLSIASIRALQNTLTAERRDKEAEVLWRGIAYREAIRLYYDNSQGTHKRYPEQLEDLLHDTRLTRPTRPLRKLYADPFTGGKWGVVRNDAGAVIGVYPQSARQPIKQTGFPPELAAFANAKQYSDWKFVYQPTSK
ncbi:type II secretion system protein [Massilia sp. BKSP1R2A-1]|uniref:type II secretion system protein n=1 Tax=Massilia sp. BKSP1R2A-1 TaxID=3422595 RepID=UPI003D3357EC